jgi:hypothetical protein
MATEHSAIYQLMAAKVLQAPLTDVPTVAMKPMLAAVMMPIRIEYSTMEAPRSSR